MSPKLPPLAAALVAPVMAPANAGLIPSLANHKLSAIGATVLTISPA